MKHLIKNENGTFDVVAVSKNVKYLNGTNQGFERRQGAIKNMRAVMALDNLASTTFQDDTEAFPKVYRLLKDGKPIVSDTKPERKYMPKK